MASLCCFGNSSSQSAGHRLGSGKGKSSQGDVKVTFGFSLVKGKANHPMEDYHVAKFKEVRGHKLGLFAIFDGHLGDTVPAYLQEHLFTNILAEKEFWTNTEGAIRSAYEKTDKEILAHSADLGQGGSTAVTAILIDGQDLWVANIGDSRAVLARRGAPAEQITVDHEPNNERSGIENRGGFVSNIPGDVPRVNGQLAVARAFGDKNLKIHLRSDPDISHADVARKAEVVILASDGLWKVMNNDEVADIALKVKNPKAAAKRLTAEAIKRESKDDISCIVLRIKA